MKSLITNVFLFCLILTFSLGGISTAQSPHIEIVPMSPLLLSQLQLGNEFFVSSGLQNVGKGEHVYLRAHDRDGAEITAYTWSLTTVPNGSNAAVTHVVDNIYFFEADVIGQYTVNLSITTASGTESTNRIISANRYTGVGGFGGTDPSFQAGHCATCHAGIDASLIEAWEQSRHATIFQRGIDGQVPGFGAGRQRTATTGLADVDLGSGSYFSLKAETGWDFPATPAPGTFQQLVNDHPQFAQVATIGCEACHGAGSLHTGAPLDKNLMKVSYTSESCMSCHDATRPTAEFHSFRRSGHVDAIWNNSFRQAAPSQNNSLQNCVRCHDGRAYINFTKGLTTNTTAGIYEQVNHITITCETCHDPHAGGLRKAPAAADTLAGGFAYDPSIFGEGATCTDCHKYRADGHFEVMNTNVTVRWGPHYGGATDMMLGKGGYHFGTQMPTSMAHLSQENSCVACHMSTAGGEFRNLLGDHSWKMRYTDDHGNTRDLIESCQSCHPAINSFADIKGADYNMSGSVQSFVDEVQGLLTMLAEALPPVGEPTISWQQIDNDNIDMKGAYWNYRFVYYDRSLGIHNPKYTIALLQRSITTLTGVEFEHTPDLPGDFVLRQNYPNPFNPTTQIEFSLPEQSMVVLEIYDITGRLINTLIHEQLATGSYSVSWNATNRIGQTVSSGTYIYRLQAGNFVQTKRMVFIK